MSSIATLFLIGVAFQIVLAALNKTVMWTLYYGEDNLQFQTTNWYEMAAWFSKQIWIDLVADLASMGFMAWATVTVFGIIADTAG